MLTYSACHTWKFSQKCTNFEFPRGMMLFSWPVSNFGALSHLDKWWYVIVHVNLLNLGLIIIGQQACMLEPNPGVTGREAYMDNKQPLPLTCSNFRITNQHQTCLSLECGRKPREKPRRHRENIQPLHEEDPAGRQVRPQNLLPVRRHRNQHFAAQS